MFSREISLTASNRKKPSVAYLLLRKTKLFIYHSFILNLTHRTFTPKIDTLYANAFSKKMTQNKCKLYNDDDKERFKETNIEMRKNNKNEEP